MEKVKKLLLMIDEFNQSQWLFVSILTTSSGLWFPFIVTYFGIPLRLLTKDTNGVVHWKPIGSIITFLTILWSFISLLAKKYTEYRENAKDAADGSDSNDNLFESVLDAICEIGERTEVINGIVFHDNDPKISMTNYCMSHANIIPDITGQMCKVLSKLLSTRDYNLHEKDIVVNIFYRFPTIDNQWYRADSHQPQTGLVMADLLKENTTFYECMYGDSNYVFHYSKQKAAEEKHYVFDSKDQASQKKDGSIACFRYEAMRNETTYIESIVAISTYGKRFASYKTEDMEKDKIENIKYNLNENIFKTFQPSITNALFNCYALKRLH